MKSQILLLISMSLGFAGEVIGQNQNEKQSAIDSLLQVLSEGKTVSGSVITLADINFETGQSQLSSVAAERIKKISAFLMLVPTLDASIEGHADNTGSNVANKKLALDRAISVKNKLLSDGVQVERLSTKGFGSDRPKVSNETEEGKSKNRRVEIVLKKRKEQVEDGEVVKVVNEQNLLYLVDGRIIGARYVNKEDELVYYKTYSDDELRYFNTSILDSIVLTNGKSIPIDRVKLDTEGVGSPSLSTTPQAGQGSQNGRSGFYVLLGKRTLKAPAGIYNISYTNSNNATYIDTLDFGGSAEGVSYNLGIEVSDDEIYLQFGYCGVLGDATMRGLYGGAGAVLGKKKLKFKPGIMFSGQYARIPLKDYEIPVSGSGVSIGGNTYIDNVSASISNRTFSVIPVLILDYEVYPGFHLRAEASFSAPITQRYVIEFDGETTESSSERTLIDISSLDRFEYDGEDYRNKNIPLGGINGILEIGVAILF